MMLLDALAIIEFDSIAAGIHAVDALIKKAPIALIRSGTVSKGRYLTLFSGSTASVEMSYQEGLASGRSAVVDHVFLPMAHCQLRESLLRPAIEAGRRATAVLETHTVCANVLATDRALKATEVTLVEIRLADRHLHGKSFSVFQGELFEVQEAIHAAESHLAQGQAPFFSRIIPAPCGGLVDTLLHSSRFHDARLVDLEGEVVS